MKTNSKLYTVTGAGSEISDFNVSDNYEKYIIRGSAIAIGNYNISIVGTPQQGESFSITWGATLDITTNSATFSILGQSFSQEELSSNMEIRATYTGSVWKVINLGSTADCCELYAEMELTPSGIHNLNSSPPDLVPAPGSGKIAFPIRTVSNFTYGTVDYIGGQIKLRNPTASTGANIININLVGADYINSTNIVDFETKENEAIQIYATSNPTTGDGSLKIQLWYKIIDL